MKSEIKEKLAYATSLFRKGKFSEAHKLYEELYTIMPENPIVMERMGTLALYGNQADKACDYFKKALQKTPWHENLWPFSVPLKSRLAMAYYRMDDFPQAMRYFKEASGPFCLGLIKELKAIASQMACFKGEKPYRIEGPDKTTVPFVVTDPLPVVEVSVNGKGPAFFILDTGGCEVVLDKVYAEYVGAQIADSFPGSYAGNKKGETAVGKINSLGIGDIVVNDVPVHVLELSAVADYFNGRKIKGIIGTRFLLHFLSTIDYAGGKLELKQLTSVNLKQLTEIAALHNVKNIPFWLVNTHFIVAEGTVNGYGPMLFFVDTGLAGGGFTASEPLLKKLGFTLDWNNATTGTGGGGAFKSIEINLTHLTLGSGENEVVKQNVPGTAIQNGVFLFGNTLGFELNGLISHAFFREHTVTFDFHSMRLVIQ